jgi:hypothetical protein
MHSPTILEQSSAALTEAAKAKHWRKAVMKLSRAELGRRTGYSVQAISVFELGYRPDGLPIKERAWVRYRAVCAGLHVKFDWRDPDASWGEYTVGEQLGTDHIALPLDKTSRNS